MLDLVAFFFFFWKKCNQAAAISFWAVILGSVIDCNSSRKQSAQTPPLMEGETTNLQDPHSLIGLTLPNAAVKWRAFTDCLSNVGSPPRRSAGGNLGISHLTEIGLPLSSRLPFWHASFNLTLSRMGWMEIVSSSLWLSRRTERVNTSILRKTIAGFASRLFGRCEICKIQSYFLTERTSSSSFLGKIYYVEF